MSGTALLMMSANTVRSQNQKEKEILNRLAETTSQEKIQYLCVQANNWENDEDIASAYQDVLENKLSFISMQNYETETIEIQDFFAFLTLYKNLKSIVKLIEEQKLFQKTLNYSHFRIKDFIETTGFRAPFAKIEDGYFLEKDLYNNRQQIFKSFCPRQRKPFCQNPLILWKYSVYQQEEFLKTLTNGTLSKFRKTLEDDTVIPATIMASGDTNFLKKYRSFLEFSTLIYPSDKEKITRTFQKAEKLALTPEYQNLFIASCPAIKTKLKWGFIPYKGFDKEQNYECPIIRKALENQNSR